MKSSAALLQQLLFAASGVLGAITVDINDAESVKAAAALVADDLLTFYHGDETGETPGIFDDEDYYWWSGSVLWGSLLDLRARTGNMSYDDVIFQGLQWQTGTGYDYLPANWSASEGNDDQSFWAQAALLAAQTNFTEAADAEAQWPILAQNVFTEQSFTERRVSDDNTACDGALRWQIFTFNSGYDYVNSIANGLYFSTGAQLAWLNDNKTASDEAIKTYDLLTDIGLVTDDFDVYDGVQVTGCDSVNKVQFSYAAATLLQGAAYTYNYTGDETWKNRIDGYLDNILETFFQDGVAIEPACESSESCNTDMYFFKGILHRSLAWTMKMAPYTADTILPVLKTSAAAAVSTCTGGDNGRMCGFTWSNGTFDISNAGAQSSVLGALVSVLEFTNVASTGSSASGSGSSGSGSSSTGSSSSNTTNTDDKSMGTNFGISFSAIVGGLTIAALFA
ncbi:hypothetical protein PFICI_10452 [Pestalotiopsis fici W106-1]|uniref:Mannan endo-1,6-alpha-mannosidase n=1 Tax=Pestalotiopsis fici (strain W106-1 / CGMCC3.15140) TaxID=1229662 RepID=W3WX16_PESFW|nr:uncharacterized protein PFICI_10452 [Pestalotiopsis fici W106-1]ETS78390.1 hypothetical protein PFICI_10452 [Pestalotiopsis fici W106-1]